jgi:hypothetical protein
LYTLTFDANGGTVSPSSKGVYHGVVVGELPLPVWTGHSFLGWYPSISFDGFPYTAISPYNAEDGTTLYAKWTDSSSTITFADVNTAVYITSGLVVHLDGINNTGTGHSTGTTIWKDLTNNGNDFSLYNSSTITGTSLLFNGSNQYARSLKTLNLTPYDSVTVEVFIKPNSITTNSMIFEHTSNWNFNVGGW